MRGAPPGVPPGRGTGDVKERICETNPIWIVLVCNQSVAGAVSHYA
jgi:hypothetical protein